MSTSPEVQQKNRRLLWILLSIVLAVFVGVMIKQWLFGQI